MQTLITLHIQLLYILALCYSLKSKCLFIRHFNIRSPYSYNLYYSKLCMCEQYLCQLHYLWKIFSLGHFYFLVYIV